MLYEDGKGVQKQFVDQKPEIVKVRLTPRRNALRPVEVRQQTLEETMDFLAIWIVWRVLRDSREQLQSFVTEGPGGTIPSSADG